MLDAALADFFAAKLLGKHASIDELPSLDPELHASLQASGRERKGGGGGGGCRGADGQACACRACVGGWVQAREGGGPSPPLTVP